MDSISRAIAEGENVALREWNTEHRASRRRYATYDERGRLTFTVAAPLGLTHRPTCADCRWSYARRDGAVVATRDGCMAHKTRFEL